MIRVLIVEDDPFAARRLVRLINQTYAQGELTLIGAVDSFQQGLDLIMREKPDIVFLDIELGPDKDGGIRLAQLINFSYQAYIIFMTGLEKENGYQLAKMTAPHDFMQKPFGDEFAIQRLEIAYQRVQKMKIAQSNFIPNQNKVLFIKTAYGEVSGISINDVSYFEADNVKIHVIFAEKDEYYCFSYNGLKNFYEDSEYLLANFIYLSRSYVINQNFVKHIKHNHVYMPIFTELGKEQRYARISIPKNGDGKQLLKIRLNLP